MPKYLSSTNLITDLAFKSKVGVKSEASVEALAVINQENEEHDLKIESEARNDLKIIAKLFLKTFDVATAKEAINSLKIALGVENIDVLTITVPASGIEMIGIGAHSANEEESDQPTKNDPKRDECSLEMQKLWNSLASELGESVTTLGLCDLETDIFIDLFKQASIPPKNFSVNLKSCCVVPPNLKQFTQENQILLQTHADLPTVLSPEFCEKITQKSAPNWIIRYQLFIKARGVLQDKRYLIQSE